MRTFVARAYGMAVMLFVAGFAEAAEPTRRLLPHSDALAMPSIGRVLVGFLLTVALAVGVAYALRRWLPQFAALRSISQSVPLEATTVVKNGVRYHVVSVNEHTVLVAEGKSGMAMTVLVPSTAHKDSDEKN